MKCVVQNFRVNKVVCVCVCVYNLCVYTKHYQEVDMIIVLTD